MVGDWAETEVQSLKQTRKDLPELCKLVSHPSHYSFTRLIPGKSPQKLHF